MPDLSEGLETVEGVQEHDVNTPGGFEAALAGLAGKEVPEGRESAPEASIAAGLTEEPAAQPRNEDGTFAPQSPTPAVEETTPPSGAEGAQTAPFTDNPDLAAYLERYDGDVGKALEAGLHASRKIGEQGNELGDLRQQLAKLEGRFEEASRYQEPEYGEGFPIVDDATLEYLEDSIARNGGVATLQQVVEHRPDLIEPTLSLWEETDDRQAGVFRTRFEVNKALQAQAPAKPDTAQPTVDPDLEQIKYERMALNAANAVFAHLPTEQRDVLKPHISTVLEELPNEIAAGLFDPQKRDEYSKIVADIARSRMVATATDQAAVERQKTTDAAKEAARVATGSLRPAAPAGGEGGELSPEERRARFHKAILETPTASISEGLTYGKS